ncbi:HAD-IC family P-type ATPase [Cyanobium sp. Morenito 9A2]|uniref:cation-translocating P-type ATPase n=1 Tax=Cyanobium sp. Morenito 9A2 TaxID=2823718 RepID=UPI0020CB9802|nr:HAD-IC family P-type ATPase [Cyanobium sp. Morenito 9A2]MCP9848576.1 HAD-IC family P-type ATPase [Cyanobium sp. Morenito 9A2]
MRWQSVLEPTNLLLLACAVLYGLIGEPTDGLVLLAFVAFISLLDGVQQQRSRRALAALAALSAPQARVRRNGDELRIPVEQVQVGDWLLLDEGDRVAADGAVVESLGLSLDESLLTGESLPVPRLEIGAPVRAGTLVAGGRGVVRVEAVAGATALGRLGASLATLKAPPTRLQRQTQRLTQRLTVMALALCALLTAVNGASSGDWPQALLAGLALALAVLPNEIPVVLALFLALGALRLARLGVLARWPAAVESLGSATVLAVDKTGTLTENRMAVKELITWPERAAWPEQAEALPGQQPGASAAQDQLGEPFHPLLELAVLASRPQPVDAMEQAIARLAQRQLQGTEHLHGDWPLEREYPLSPDLLVFSRLWRDPASGWQLAAKGAPEAVSELCHLAGPVATAFLAEADRLAAGGLRVLAVARGLQGLPQHLHPDGLKEGNLPPELLHDYLFEPLGLIGLADPLRADVPASVARAQAAGVRVVMITGDGPTTARVIAEQAGLGAGVVLTGDQLDRLAPSERAAAAKQVNVFARVRPEQKLALVQALQAAGEVVAMGGDGVNDGPALRAADIGVAMGRRGTAVAREASDLVLLNDAFADLVEALAMGRRVYANLGRALAYTLAVHLPIAALGLIPLLVPGQPLLLLPVHIALLHLVIEPACTGAFEAQPGDPAQMRQPPRSLRAPLFGPAAWRLALVQGGVLLVVVLVLALAGPGGLEGRRALVLSVLLLASGGLVWINRVRIQGGPPALTTILVAASSLLLWGLLQVWSPLRQSLALAPPGPWQVALSLAVAGGSLLVLALLTPGLLVRSASRSVEWT